jgi:hypothetical protein
MWLINILEFFFYNCEKNKIKGKGKWFVYFWFFNHSSRWFQVVPLKGAFALIVQRMAIMCWNLVSHMMNFTPIYECMHHEWMDQKWQMNKSS